MSEVLFFGCLAQGHHLYEPPHTWCSRDTPWGAHGSGIDGVLLGWRGHALTGTQMQGQGQLHHKDGWSAFAFWDRTGPDQRFGGNSAFLVAEDGLSFADIAERGRAAFPVVDQRLAAHGIVLGRVHLGEHIEREPAAVAVTAQLAGMKALYRTHAGVLYAIPYARPPAGTAPPEALADVGAWLCLSKALYKPAEFGAIVEWLRHRGNVEPHTPGNWVVLDSKETYLCR